MPPQPGCNEPRLLRGVDSSLAAPEDFAAPLPAPSFTYASDELSRLARQVVRSIERVSGQPRIRRMYLDYQRRRRPRERFWDDAVAALRLIRYIKVGP